MSKESEAFGELQGHKVLVVEDDLLLRKQLCGYLHKQGAMAEGCANLAAARNAWTNPEWDTVLLDVNLPDGNGLEFLATVEIPADRAVVVMTATGGAHTVIEALRSGAADYIAKPFDYEELPVVFSRIHRNRRWDRIESHRRASADKGELLWAGLSDPWREQLDAVVGLEQHTAGNLPPILLVGETGTGKTSLARWLHAKGARAAGPLIEVNCSTLPDALAESELFGHERGAFTDAKSSRMGLFEAAHGGTLFLDEVTSLSPAVQAKLLTVIEDGMIRKLGGSGTRAVNVRLIAAALPDLAERVRGGAFREDLFHRLNLVRIELPPLRERLSGLRAMVEGLLAAVLQKYGRQGGTVSSASWQRMQQYDWPGNVRELLHELERSVIFSRGGELELLAAHDNLPIAATGHLHLLNPAFVLPETGFELEQELQNLTDHIIRSALEAEQGNVSAAARRLGVTRDFIRYRI